MSAEERLNAGMVSINAPNGHPIGAGFVAAPDLVCTAAHVITKLFARLPAEPGVGAQVEIRFLATGTTGTAVIELWQPRRETDIAVLRLTGPAPDAVRPVRLVDVPDAWGHRCRMFGFPEHHPDGVWAVGTMHGRQGSGWLQIDDDRNAGFWATQGFSGGPVWDDERQAVTGMIVATEALAGRRTAYAQPAAALLAAKPELAGWAEPPGRWDDSPFRGLEPFREQDAPLYFGRATEAAELAETVWREPFTVLNGASGTGKSSLLSAGVLPRLRARPAIIVGLRVAAGVTADGVLTRALSQAFDLPDATPAEIAAALRAGRIGDFVVRALDHAYAQRLIIVVDQLEELVGHEPAQATELFTLLRALWESTRTVRVIVTLRSDFLDQAAALSGLGAAWTHAITYLAPLTGDALREAVEGPLAAAGRAAEPRLVDRILTDAGATAGALPMVEFLLERLWRSEPGDVLTHETYDALGGVGGVIAGYAEEVLRERIPQAELPAVRSLMLRLVQPTAAGTALRRPVRAQDLTPAMLAVARELAAARLVVTSQDRESGAVTYELTHDALTRRWQRLEDWLKESADFWQWYESLRISREQQEPLRGVRLEAARNWLRTNGDDLTQADRDFILASQQRSRRFTWAWRSAAGALVVLLLATGGFALVVKAQSAELESDLRDARARDQAAQAVRMLTTDPSKAVATALTAYHNRALPESESALFQLYAQLNNIEHMLPGTEKVQGLAVTSDPPALLTAEPDLRRWRFDGAGQPVSEVLADRAQDVITDQSGTRIAFVGSHDVFVILPDGERVNLPFDHRINLERFDVSGQALLLRVQRHEGDPIRAMIWNLRDRSETALPPENVTDAWFGPDAGTVLLKLLSGETLIWDVNAGRSVQTITDDVAGVTPDGKWLVRCPQLSRRSPLRMYELPAMEQVRELTTSCMGVFGVQLGFDPAGDVLLNMPDEVVSRGRQALHVIDTDTGLATTVAMPHQGSDGLFGQRVVPVALPHDGGWMVAYAADGAVVVANVRRDSLTELGADLTGVDAQPVDAVGSLAVARGAKPVRLWDLASGRRVNSALPDRERVLLADDRYLFTASDDDKTMSLRDLRDPAQVRHRLDTRPSPKLPPPPEGYRLGWACVVRTDTTLVHFNGSILRRWDYPSMRPQDPLDLTGEDGIDTEASNGKCDYSDLRRLLVLHTADRDMTSWNIDTGKRQDIFHLEGELLPQQLVFDESGDRLAVRGERGQVRVADFGTGRSGAPMTPPDNTAVEICCQIQSLHGDTLYLQKGEQIAVWSVGRGELLRTLVLPRADDVGLDRISIDGDATTLTASDTDFGIQRYSLDPQQWRASLCGVLSRGFTDEERANAAGNPDDEDICPSWKG
ncbi:nSTAND1 domain-containing NTPase [Catellatospora vulcania]|uniref:nSTAND1 domain-containing NTPase n=1 Tax=Catellatospora vulcania TaxID=1460450 RepID=UPI0012D3AAF3|nr:trypsin-like peptidase domain-containing protein [Catellatospora vulcania]